MKKVIFDNIHGYITLNRVETRILETLYYQRLRWIRQLGFSFYIFPGATHTRHAHALGVSHVMDRILRSLGLATSDEKMFDPKSRDEKTTFHRMMRLAAMLHDIGTFPFSHSVEMAYINHWRHQLHIGKPKYTANHEVLGSHIILNTDFDGGITRILKDEGIDPVELSQIIAGKSQNLLANQLMHADVDADRMDYLIRDANHTGVKIGLFDLDFLIRAMRLHSENGQQMLCIAEDGINVVDSFLVARYFWYSQIIHEGASYKFDLLAAKIGEYFLENQLAFSFDNLMDKVSMNPYEYFTFNDSYFMAKLHDFLSGKARHPMIGELSEMLARRIPPAQIRIAPLKPTVIQNEEHRKQLVVECQKAVEWLKDELKSVAPDAWLIEDIPQRDVLFTRTIDNIKKTSKGDPVKSRDTVKVLTRHNELKLLVDVSQSLMKVLSQYRNFIPRVYVSPATYHTLEKKGVLEKMRTMKWS
ncbi:MAG: HD domain-containing protein [Pseudobdellovibrionaceae bacterium]